MTDELKTLMGTDPDTIIKALKHVMDRCEKFSELLDEAATLLETVQEDVEDGPGWNIVNEYTLDAIADFLIINREYITTEA